MYYLETSEKTRFGEHFSWTRDNMGDNPPYDTLAEAEQAMDTVIEMWPDNDYRVVDEGGHIELTYDGYVKPSEDSDEN